MYFEQVRSSVFNEKLRLVVWAWFSALYVNMRILKRILKSTVSRRKEHKTKRMWARLY